MRAPSRPTRCRSPQGALWGAIRHHGLMPDTVVVSDGAGQFRVGLHALCWVHAERLVHTLIPTTAAQRKAIALTRTSMLQPQKRDLVLNSAEKFNYPLTPPMVS